MTPDELELAKEGIKESVKQTLAPVQDIVRQVSGPAATEVGLILGDYFRVWRLKRAVRLLEDVKQAASDSGLTLKPVAPRLLFPILDAATLEEEPELHRRWVALLTNAATSFDGEMLPSFPDVLKQLVSAEVQLLDRAYDEVLEDEAQAKSQLYPHNRDNEHTRVAKSHIRESTLDSTQPILVEDLERLALISRIARSAFTDDLRQVINKFIPSNELYITDFGGAFVRACRLPQGRKV